jgi:predicted kinase
LPTPELIICRGLPASGKTTYSKKWVLEDPENRARVNRDSFRAMMHVDVANTTQLSEGLITRLSQEAVRTYLKAGVSVIVDDTNLRLKTAREWATIAKQEGAEFLVKDFHHVTLEECLRRNKGRDGEVPEHVITGMHQRYLASLKGGFLPFPEPIEVATRAEAQPVEFDPDLPNAVIVDIDGTIAQQGDRDIYDEAKAHLDSVHWDVVTAAASVAHSANAEIIVMSGRKSEHRDVTVGWLQAVWDGISPYNGPFMRPEGDTRKDYVVKRDLFDEHVRGKYNVVAVFDDRNQVVSLWRSLGLRCYQVAPGDF